MSDNQIEVGDRVEHRGAYGQVVLVLDSGVCIIRLDGGISMRSIRQTELKLVAKCELTDTDS